MQLEEEAFDPDRELCADGDELHVELERHHEDDGHRDEKQDERGAEIGLLGDEEARQREEAERDRDVPPGPQAKVYRVRGEELRECEDHRDLRELRRLPTERADADPATRAVH